MVSSHSGDSAEQEIVLTTFGMSSYQVATCRDAFVCLFLLIRLFLVEIFIARYCAFTVGAADLCLGHRTSCPAS